MDIKNDPKFAGITAKMKYLEESFKAQASNLARADIPGESAVEIESVDFKKMVAKDNSGSIRKTNSNHMSGVEKKHSGKYKLRKDNSSPATEYGNNINSQKVASEMTNISMEHKKLTLIYKAGIAQIKKVIGR